MFRLVHYLGFSLSEMTKRVVIPKFVKEMNNRREITDIHGDKTTPHEYVKRIIEAENPSDI